MVGVRGTLMVFILDTLTTVNGAELCNVTSFHPLFGRDQPARLLVFGMQVY